MHYSGISALVIEARCDWLTCTAKHDERGQRLLDFGMLQVENEHKLGSEVKPYRMRGYLGYQTKHVRTGWGKEGGICALSGDMAALFVELMAKMADHWSRVDLCVTCRVVKSPFDPPTDYFSTKERLLERPKGHPVMSQYRELWGGNTFYIGSRVSPYYCRCYNKTAESKGDYPPGCWRWEVEMKRHASERLQERVLADGITTDFVAARVAYEFQRNHLGVPWQPPISVVRDPQIKHRPDAERKLQWLETSVRPSVDFVREARGDDAVLAALDLPHVHYESEKSERSF